MNVYVCVCMYMYVYIYVCVCIYVCICMYIYICVSRFLLTFPIMKYFIRKNNIIILMQYNTV